MLCKQSRVWGGRRWEKIDCRHRSGNLIFVFFSLFLESFSPLSFWEQSATRSLKSCFFIPFYSLESARRAETSLGRGPKESINLIWLFFVSRMLSAGGVGLDRREKLENFLILCRCGCFFSLTDIEINLITSFRDLQYIFFGAWPLSLSSSQKQEFPDSWSERTDYRVTNKSINDFFMFLLYIFI